MLVFKFSQRKTLDGILNFLLKVSPLAAVVNKFFLFFHFFKEIFKNTSSSKNYDISLELVHKNVLFEKNEINF